MLECYKNEENEGYEIFVNETLKNNIAGYGIFCKKNSKYNYYSRVEGKQTLQNAMYQGILHVLKGIPKDENIDFILDRKEVIDIFEKFPKTYRECQNSLHLDTLLQIEEIMKERTAPIRFFHCYSYTKETDELDMEKNISNKKKIESIIEKYSKETAYRYIEGNNQADLLADTAIEIPEIKVPTINKYQNKYIIKSTRKKSTKKGSKDQVINTRIKTTIKEQIKTQFSSNM
jgi:hypothetical protein